MIMLCSFWTTWNLAKNVKEKNWIARGTKRKELTADLIMERELSLIIACESIVVEVRFESHTDTILSRGEQQI